MPNFPQKLVFPHEGVGRISTQKKVWQEKKEKKWQNMQFSIKSPIWQINMRHIGILITKQPLAHKKKKNVFRVKHRTNSLGLVLRYRGVAFRSFFVRLVGNTWCDYVPYLLAFLSFNALFVSRYAASWEYFRSSAPTTYFQVHCFGEEQSHYRPEWPNRGGSDGGGSPPCLICPLPSSLRN